MSALSGVRPTKGYLIEMTKRLSFIERGCEFLKLKRDHLAKELSISLEVLRGRRDKINERLKEVYGEIVTAHLDLGPSEVKSQTTVIKKIFEIDVLPKSVMGVRYPSINVISKPKVGGKLDPTLSKAASTMLEIFDDIIRLAEFEARAERVADELGKTNRKVNALENIVIPSYRNVIKFIQDKLDEEGLEELVRTKLIGGAIARRRE
jgi:V/A-type H+-transporting ATPase subunit D